MGADGGGPGDFHDPAQRSHTTTAGDVVHRRSERTVAKSPKGLAPRSLERALDFIHANLGEHVSLEQLAGSVPISRYHFARRFRCSTGLSPMAFLMRARIDRATELLRGKVDTITDIAIGLGFSDQSHFTRVFRAVVGMTPGAYARLRTSA